MNDAKTHDAEQPQLVASCRQLSAFQQLNNQECQQLLAIAQQRAFAPGEQVIEQGQRSQLLWILLEGKCEVVRHSKHDGSLVLAQLEPQSVFGEMSFFSPAPHSASVVAKTQVRLLSISRLDYDKLRSSGSAAAYKLAYNIVESMAYRLRRMDDWVAELAAASEHTNGHIEQHQREWQDFRKKLFESWNL